MAFIEFMLDHAVAIIVALAILGILGKIAESKGYGPNGWRTQERERQRDAERRNE